MKQKGFTLIELLVVIAIIGLLASVVMVSLNSARQKARIAKRAADLSEIAKALELYYNDNNGYPNPGWGYRSQCANWGGLAANQVIPGLVPTYMSSFPSDPSMNTVDNQNCYLYLSDGTNYKFLDYNLANMTVDQLEQYPTLVDPCRGPNSGQCGSPPYNDLTQTWAIYSPGGRSW